MDENKSIKKKLLKITWPIFIESLLLSTLGMVDTFMVSRYSDSAVAAVGISNQIIGMINLMFVIITSGTSILVAQYIGANKDGKKNNEIIQLCGVSIGFNTLIGLVLSIVLVFFGIAFLKLLNTSNDILYLANDYLKYVGGFIFIQAISMTITAILRPHGLVKICMYVTLFVNVVNTILNYILIFGKFGMPELGVTGSALGTPISKFIGLCILCVVLYKKILNMWVISVGLGYILSIKCGLGLIGIWIGLACDECFRAILVFFRWKNRKWEGKAYV